jgi:thiamine biosynthesis protein ThiS
VSDQIVIAVNGQTRQTAPGLYVRALLEELGVVPDRVAVELNGTIVRKAEWDNTLIPDGAKLEIVQFVGGG